MINENSYNKCLGFFCMFFLFQGKAFSQNLEPCSYETTQSVLHKNLSTMDNLASIAYKNHLTSIDLTQNMSIENDFSKVFRNLLIDTNKDKVSEGFSLNPELFYDDLLDKVMGPKYTQQETYQHCHLGDEEFGYRSNIFRCKSSIYLTSEDAEIMGENKSWKYHFKQRHIFGAFLDQKKNVFERLEKNKNWCGIRLDSIFVLELLKKSKSPVSEYEYASSWTSTAQEDSKSINYTPLVNQMALVVRKKTGEVIDFKVLENKLALEASKKDVVLRNQESVY